MRTPAVAVVGIELKRDETVRIPRGTCERRKESRRARGFGRVALEIEIGRELFRGFVENVEFAVEVADEKPVQSATWFFAQEIHPCDIHGVFRGRVQCAGLGNRSVVGELNRHSTLSLKCEW